MQSENLNKKNKCKNSLALQSMRFEMNYKAVESPTLVAIDASSHKQEVDEAVRDQARAASVNPLRSALSPQTLTMLVKPLLRSLSTLWCPYLTLRMLQRWR